MATPAVVKSSSLASATPGRFAPVAESVEVCSTDKARVVKADQSRAMAGGGSRVPTESLKQPAPHTVVIRSDEEN